MLVLQTGSPERQDAALRPRATVSPVKVPGPRYAASGSSALRRLGTTALWIFVVSTATAVAASLRAVPANQTWWQVLRAGLAFAYAWGALSLPIVVLDRRLARRVRNPAAGLLWHLPGSLLVAALSAYAVPAFSVLLAAPGGPKLALSLEPLRQAGRWGLASQMILYWAVVGACRAVHYYARYQERALRAAELEKLLVQSQLQALRMQLDPHFLFNALNTISAELESDPRRARRMLEQLGELLRCSLESQDQQEVPLAQELKLLQHYLAIQEARFEDRLRIELCVPEETLEARVPSQLLQPLVENALRHGLAPRAEGGRVRIEAARAGAELRLRVTDDGVGLPADGASAGASGRGLSITRQRLARLYPDGRGRLDVRNLPEAGVVAEVVIPWLTAGDRTEKRDGRAENRDAETIA
jgi:two-component system, LytTR family, sensor kinase